MMIQQVLTLKDAISAHNMRKILSIMKLRKFELHELIVSFSVRRLMTHHSMSVTNDDKSTQKHFVRQYVKLKRNNLHGVQHV
jgi:hypothetical protein